MQGCRNAYSELNRTTIHNDARGQCCCNPDAKGSEGVEGDLQARDLKLVLVCLLNMKLDIWIFNTFKNRGKGDFLQS